jgi:nitrite reductase/ring-hydroxylating ferredoxin subunit
VIHSQRAGDGPADVDQGTEPPDGRAPSDQPKWRRDFPIDLAQDEYVSRRELVKFMVLTSAALAVGQVWLVVRRAFTPRTIAPEAQAIAGVEDLPIGGARTFNYPAGSTPRILVRTGAAAFVAYDQQCTHLMCPVVPAVELGRLHCPCHNGWFDLHTGQPVAGPPQRALPRVHVEVRGGTVYATAVEDPAS